MDELSVKAKAILEKIIYITIATVSKGGQPWNSPVYSAFDDQHNFYWASWKENQHSKNIRENNRIFLVIYDSTAPEGTGEGVYVLAQAEELSDPAEIDKALALLAGRKHKTPKPAEEFLGDYPRRVYKAVPQKMWMNGDGDVNGNYIDVRMELPLPL